MLHRSPILYRLVASSFRLLCILMGRLRLEGSEYIPSKGPVILAANHLSHLDPPLIATASPRYVFFMAKAELFQTPIIGPYLRRIGTFPVKRGAPDRAALRQAFAILEAGEVLGILPEGHRSEDGFIQDAEDGAAFIALRSRATVVPTAITGTEKLLPPHSSRLHFSRVRLRFGSPVILDDLYGQTGREAIAEATRRIMAAITSMLPPEYIRPVASKGTDSAKSA